MKNIVIIGANRGIGQAIKDQLSKEPDNQIIATSRQYATDWHQHKQTATIHCDLNDAASIDACSKTLSQQLDHIDCLINCAGVLHTKDYRPEKALSQVNGQQLLDNYATNAVGHLLLNKKLERLIAKADQPVVCSVSARIGSIADNQLGGWYAYRMSKAALNMGFKTLSIEWQRKFPQVNFMLLHPGTTDTELSAPFQKSLPSGQLQSPTETADLLLQQIFRYQQQRHRGVAFMDYAGQTIDW